MNQPERYQLVVDDYYAADLFRSHGNRGSTYLFLRWCADRYGPDLLATLAGSNLRGIANLEAASGATFADLFRRWSIALYDGGVAPTGPARVMPATPEDVTSIKLAGASDEHELVGPRFVRVSPGAPAHKWSAMGTTAHYVVVDGASSPYVAIDVSAPADAELQVTAVPLGPDLARLDLAVEKHYSAATGLSLRARIRERHGIPVRLSTFSWEPQTPTADPAKSVPRCGRLSAEAIARTFSAAELAGDGELVSSLISLTGSSPASGPLVVKIVGTDANGHRVVGWAQLDLDSGIGRDDLY